MMKEKIISFCNSIGLDTVGVIPCRTFEELRGFYQERQEKKLQNEFEENDIEKRINPAHYMEDGKSIISIAFPYVDDEEEQENGFSIYTKRYDYHRVVHGYLDQVCEYIQSLGGNAEGFVDSNTLPERYIAYLAGVGFIGRNNMIITEKYGSYVFLGEIITDLDLGAEDSRMIGEISLHKECGDCSRCYGECPTKSINANRKNPNICLSYLTQKKEISDQEIGLLKGNVFGCDFCQLKCPYNEMAGKSPIPEFQTLSYMNEDAKVYAEMDNKYFKEKMSKTSCGWRGKNVLRRNAILKLHKQGEDVTSYLGDSEYINEYIRRLTNKEK
ncbi:MAG: tRNA epoxyqueuosine(34) reductase QueG [bacterium]|nr:tRNA epoxyqueuosine(34) reductase QueG [bacterium]